MDINEMIMENFNYYLLYPEPIPSSPSVILSDNKFGRDDAMVEEYILNVDSINFSFWEPYPQKPVMTDFHDNGIIGVVSKRIFNMLDMMHINKLQMIPAKVHDPRNKAVFDDYYFLHIYNRIACMDKEKSIFDYDDFADEVEDVDKLVLDVSELSKIPLEDRLVFRLKEVYTFQLFHELIVDAIMAINPRGIRFLKVEDYNAGVAFD